MTTAVIRAANMLYPPSNRSIYTVVRLTSQQVRMLPEPGQVRV